MLGTKNTHPDCLSIDRSSFFQSRSALEENTQILRQNHSSFSQNRASRSNLASSAAPSLPDISQIATAANNITAFNVRTQQIAGTLRADRFTVSRSVDRTVISGNGNVDFGSGYRDLLDLSDISYSSVQVNWASPTGGIIYNPGNGSRVFDAINFSDGRQVLFEGIDTIQFAEGIVNLSITPNDPLFSRQWNLHMMGVHNAWRFTQGSTDVLIGIQDTGLTIDNTGAIHPELQRTLVLGDQFVDDRFNNHGLSVQGIIAATSNNGIGMSGINWNSSVYNIDVLDQNSGDLDTASAAQSMINQARQNGQRLVINLSLGKSESFGTNLDQELEQIVRNNPDVLFVISAGNEGHLGVEGISSPAILARSYSNVMAIGAVWGTQAKTGEATVPGSRIQYQGRGAWGSQYGVGLTVMGPSEVIAPNAIDEDGVVRFDFTSTFDGTSAAAPNVTGVASLVLSANPYLSASQVKQILAQTSVDVGQPGYDVLTGSGVVNADAAVRRAMALARGFT